MDMRENRGSSIQRKQAHETSMVKASNTNRYLGCGKRKPSPGNSLKEL